MTWGRRAAAAGAAVLLGATLAGCGGSGGDKAEKDADHGSSAAADLTTCMSHASAAATPYGKAFPQDWPFPPRSVVFHAEDRGAEGTIVTAVSATPFTSILRFMNHDVASAGYKVEQGETEEHDAEAEWKGNGFRGRWAIRESAKCPGETVVQVLSTDR